MGEIQPADTFKDAWNLMETELDRRDRFDSLYVERGYRRTVALAEAFRMDTGCLHILFSGFNRSGKSTELFRLQYRLQDDFAPVYLSVDRLFERADVEHTDLLLGMCGGILSRVEQEGIDSAEYRERFNEWVSGLLDEAEMSTSTGKSRAAEFGGELTAAFAKFFARYKVEHETREDIRKRLRPRTGEIVDMIGLLAADLQHECRPPLVIVDDLEKADAETARGIFREHAGTLQSVGCDVIYTIPYSLVNAPEMHAAQRGFDDTVILPMITVTDRRGEPVEDGVERIVGIITERASSELFEPEALRKLALLSGGVVGDALRMARNSCLAAKMAEEGAISEGIVEDEAMEIIRAYRRGLDEEHYPVLVQVAKDRDARMDDEQRTLADALAILEYENDPNWYDVHPLVRKLLELRGMLP
ncbi:MAG: hypothetical protein ACQER1_17460 [Armatimonadota bacterium]